MPKLISLIRYNYELQPKLDDIKVKLINKSKLEDSIKVKLHKIPGFVCNVQGGFACDKPKYFIIPSWLYKKSNDYIEWYISHELSHLVAYIKKVNSNHSTEFYEFLKLICPKKSQHYELGYKPQNAKKCGIKKKKRKKRIIESEV
jgi:hypothetical protein